MSEVTRERAGQIASEWEYGDTGKLIWAYAVLAIEQSVRAKAEKEGAME